MNDSFDSKFEAHIERVIAGGSIPVSAPDSERSRDSADADSASSQLFVCTDCGHLGQPEIATRGDLRTEAMLWLALILPGVVYSVWRLTTRGQGCSLCHGRHIIPATSPLGRKLLTELANG